MKFIIKYEKFFYFGIVLLMILTSLTLKSPEIKNTLSAIFFSLVFIIRIAVYKYSKKEKRDLD
ncbi:hypothetical protein FS935_10985 [Metabacillus litoralis]|uniref:Uncharacterized protein n=1 Tax=Metabacillus litoralis TaxID=152268 RepID=A0A5C6W3T3_9BACI|nr:hypothetical protein [Metabacillus litoralis]TXC90456.1 hypothetical protein FS935_10985 [Metabacillus litoralis]